MKSNPEETYEKHAYEINIVDCALQVVKKLRTEKEQLNIDIDVDQYKYRLKIAIQEYKRSIGYDRNAPETIRKRACVVPTAHPSFDFWLSLHLSTMDPDEIPLLLDAYHDGDFGHIDLFVGHVQYFVLKILKYNVFSDYALQKQAITAWVREMRREEKNVTAKGVKYIHIEHLNILINLNVLNLDLKIENQLNQYFDNRSIQNHFNPVYHFHNDQANQSKSEEKSETPTSQAGLPESPESELIPVSLKFEEVLSYFIKLTSVKSKKDQKPFLTEDDVIYLIKSNFKINNVEPIASKKHFHFDIQKQYLVRFVYEFYSKKDDEYYTHKASLYCKFLIDNFKIFKNNNLDQLKRNFSRATTGPYPFS